MKKTETLPDYIQITYEDGEVWKARWDAEEGCYCSDDVIYVVRDGKSSYKVGPCEFLDEPLKDIKKNKSMKVRKITQEAYKQYVNQRLLDYFQEDIERLEQELKQKREEQSALLALMQTN